MDNLKIGQTVELVKMDDVSAPPIGTRGVIKSLNPITGFGANECQVGVKWENGSRLMVLLPYDEIKIVE